MKQSSETQIDEFNYHSERARTETMAALAAEDPRIAAIHVQLATAHVRSCRQGGAQPTAPAQPVGPPSRG